VSAAVLVFVACVLCCVVAQAAILTSLVRRPSGTADPGVPRPKLGVEILWALIPAIVLAFLLTATWVRVRENATHRPGVMMKVAQ
jgi:heme/copper-type cytochrome/quinol oxidase subunit 2